MDALSGESIKREHIHRTLMKSIGVTGNPADYPVEAIDALPRSYNQGRALFLGSKAKMGAKQGVLTVFQQLLELHRSLPEERLERTFMQISGYPHYENVCSNILAFFLDPANEHDLDDLLLQAVMQAVGEESVAVFDSVEVMREYPVDGGGRLDLVVTSQDWTLAIENKIFHDVNNDLAAYSATVQSLAAARATEHKCILLALSEPDASLNVDSLGFVSLTYARLFQQLKGLMGHYGVHGHSKYLTYLYDFIRTIEDLQGGRMSNQAKAAFYEKNHAEIEQLLADYKKYKAWLGPQHVNKLHALVKDLEGGPRVHNQWIHANYVLVADFEFGGINYVLETVVSPAGWTVQLWARSKRGSAEVLDTLLNAIELAGYSVERPLKGRPIVARFALNTPHAEIANCLRRCHQIIHQQLDVLDA